MSARGSIAVTAEMIEAGWRVLSESGLLESSRRPAASDLIITELFEEMFKASGRVLSHQQTGAIPHAER